MKKLPTRYLSLFLPSWSTDLVRAKSAFNPARAATEKSGSGDGHEKAGVMPPILLTASVANQEVVKRCCAASHAAGIREGMSLALARAVVPHSLAAAFDALRDFRALYKFSLYCTRFTPLVGIDADLFRAFQESALDSMDRSHSGLILNITGTERLHAGEKRLADRILQTLAGRGVAARIGIAPTIGAAWAISRCTHEPLSIIPQGASLSESLASLPLAALRCPGETETRLQELGIGTVGALLKLPSKTLGVRFGLPLLKRVHQLLGVVDETFIALSPKTPPALSRSFEIPLQRREAVQFTALGLADKLLLMLSLHGVRARSFAIRIEGQDSDRRPRQFSKEISLNTVTRNIAQLRGILAPIVEEIRFEHGVTKITVAGLQIERLIAEQEDFTESKEIRFATDAASELLNSLSARLGPDRVRRAAFHESYLPERSFSYPPVPANYLRLMQELPPGGASTARTLPDRPPYLFDAPEPASAIALLPDHPPARILWRGIQHEIRSGTGPERILPEWWKDTVSERERAERDYFKLQNQEGLWLWVYRDQRSQRWWVHGLWV